MVTKQWSIIRSEVAVRPGKLRFHSVKWSDYDKQDYLN